MNTYRSDVIDSLLDIRKKSEIKDAILSQTIYDDNLNYKKVKVLIFCLLCNGYGDVVRNSYF